MALKNSIGIGPALILALALLWAGASAQSSSCTNVLMTMSPCLNYITGNTSTPSSGCCSVLASVIASQPECLCEALSSDTSSLGLNINTTLAMALPAACNVQTPSLSNCNAASPSDSPSGTTPESPNSVPTGRGSNSVPSTQSDGSSDASSIKISISMLFILLASFTMH